MESQKSQNQKKRENVKQKQKSSRSAQKATFANDIRKLKTFQKELN